MRSSRLLEELRLEELTPDSLTAQERAQYTRLAWVDRQNDYHDVDYPLTAEVIEDLKETMVRKAPPKVEEAAEGQEPLSYYVVRKYRDEFLPAITLVLALEYFHKGIEDIEVVLGRHIRIPAPEVFNEESGAWEPYTLVVKPEVADEEGNVVSPAVTRTVPEILIPISEQGQLLINFMGVRSSASPSGHQTFPVRSYAGYAGRNAGPDPEKWPRTMAMAGKIVMVGPFSTGMAEDEKTTPRGLMFGVEIHANALNTILMNNFLYYVQPWVNSLILLGLALLTAFMASRLPTIWSLVLSLILIVLFFFAVTLLFELSNRIITLSAPVFAILLSFLAVIVYRIMTEEKDKRRIRDMFGKYVSPSVVDQILQNPPELGGVDKELTVFFSDIRGFTTLSESMTPQELINHLNRYLTAMTDVIMLFQGTLDKYIGDAIMSFWGAPLPQADHAMLACKCALRQMQVLGELNATLPAGAPPQRRHGHQLRDHDRREHGLAGAHELHPDRGQCEPGRPPGGHEQAVHDQHHHQRVHLRAGQGAGAGPRAGQHPGQGQEQAGADLRAGGRAGRPGASRAAGGGEGEGGLSRVSRGSRRAVLLCLVLPAFALSLAGCGLDFPIVLAVPDQVDTRNGQLVPVRCHGRQRRAGVQGLRYLLQDLPATGDLSGGVEFRITVDWFRPLPEA